jgi:hypothetical protein
VANGAAHQGADSDIESGSDEWYYTSVMLKQP